MTLEADASDYQSLVSDAAEGDLEDRFAAYWDMLGDETELVRQYRGLYRLNKTGKLVRTRHRFDFCVPALKVAFEIQGGVWSGGAHNRARGYTKDRDRMALAMKQGWLIREYTTLHFDDPYKMIADAKDFIRIRRAQKREAVAAFEAWKAQA